MTYPLSLREKARVMRRDKELTIDEIAERLAVGRTTVFSWVHDMPRPARCEHRVLVGSDIGRARGVAAMKAKYKRLRVLAYELGFWEFDRLCREQNFRDFVCLYIAEGYKRCRNTVAIGNSDLAVVLVGQQWIVPMTRNKVAYSVQYHADQKLEALRTYWSTELGLPPEDIRLQRKSNSSGLAGRSWRSKHGVLTVSVGDTQLRSRLQGWIDRLEGRWLESVSNGA